MKLGFIDIGSNSVRLMMWADGKTLYKRLITTRLAEGLGDSGSILPEAAVRTAQAVFQFRRMAEAEGAERVYVFATEALRAAKNGKEVQALLERESGLTVDILSGETEAAIGLLGALGDRDGGIIDVGGGSTEVTVRNGGKVIYAKSLPIGAVRVLDACRHDKQKTEQYVQSVVGGFMDAPQAQITAIGGTATALAALDLRLKTYQPSAVTGYVMTVEVLKQWADRLMDMDVSQRRALVGMEQGRAEIIGGGAMILYYTARSVNAAQIRISDEDNLEGYARRVTAQ